MLVNNIHTNDNSKFNTCCFISQVRTRGRSVWNLKSLVQHTRHCKYLYRFTARILTSTCKITIFVGGMFFVSIPCGQFSQVEAD